MSKFHLFIFVSTLTLAAAMRIWLHKPVILPKNQYVKLEATVKREPRIDGSNQLIYIADARVYVDLYPRYRVGDRLGVEGEIDQKGRIFDARVKKIGHKASFGGYFSTLRTTVSQNIGGLLPSQEATILSGTVLGLDTIEKSFRDELIKTGTIHIVVVSGQNLMIVAGVFISFSRYLGRRLSLFLAIMAASLYAMLAGFEPPVVRAMIMVLISSLAIYSGRVAYSLWSLFLAALMIIFIWPQALFELSFQLTFAATFGIITLGQYLIAVFGRKDTVRSRSVVAKLANGIVQNGAIASSAYLLTVPLILFYFGKVSPIAPFPNILIAEAVFPIMVLGFLIAAVSLVFLPLAQVLAYFAYVPTFYFVKVVAIFSKVPIESISMGKGNLAFVLAFYLLIFGLIWIWTKRLSHKSKAGS